MPPVCRNDLPILLCLIDTTSTTMKRHELGYCRVCQSTKSDDEKESKYRALTKSTTKNRDSLVRPSQRTSCRGWSRTIWATKIEFDHNMYSALQKTRKVKDGTLFSIQWYTSSQKSRKKSGCITQTTTVIISLTPYIILRGQYASSHWSDMARYPQPIAIVPSGSNVVDFPAR